MKKNYITPEIKVMQLEALCSGVFATVSVYEETTTGERIDKFDVVNEDATKTENKDLWGESNSGNWGDD